MLPVGSVVVPTDRLPIDVVSTKDPLAFTRQEEVTAVAEIAPSSGARMPVVFRPWTVAAAELVVTLALSDAPFRISGMPDEDTVVGFGFDDVASGVGATPRRPVPSMPNASGRPAYSSRGRVR